MGENRPLIPQPGARGVELAKVEFEGSLQRLKSQKEVRLPYSGCEAWLPKSGVQARAARFHVLEPSCKY